MSYPTAMNKPTIERLMKFSREVAESKRTAESGSDKRLVLCNRWRRLANSWLAATANIPRGDHVRDNAETRAQAYRDCADELTALVRAENNQALPQGGVKKGNDEH